MRVMVLGAGGLLGRSLVASVPAAHQVTPLTRAEADIRDSAALARTLREVRPDWVLNATAYTDVDGAERDRDLAFAVNADAVGELASFCKALGAGLMHFSTDYVFAGDKMDCYREDDAVAPVNAYGASKEAGERLVRDRAGRHVIIRTQWLFGSGGKSFLSTVKQRAASRQPIRVVEDEYGCCTYVADLSAVAWSALGRLEGTFHVANRGRVSRCDVARRVYEAAEAGQLVTPVTSADIAVVAKRPSSSQLCVDKVEAALGRPMPHWTDAVDRYLAAVA